MTRDLKHALAAFAIATAGVAVLAQVARLLPFASRNLGALVAVVFLYVPVYFARRRDEDISDYGFHVAPLGKGLGLSLGSIALVFPIFALGFVLFYDVVCADGSTLASLAPPGRCAFYDGWEGARWPSLDLQFAELAFVQLVVIALPEELLFRGFIHEMCERALPPKRRVLGGGVGWALVLSSLLFALGHLAVSFDLRRLSVFFPGLMFGWMRSATGSILAGTLAHAVSNLFIDVLERIFF